MQAAQGVLQVSGPHVLAGVHSEARHAHVHQLVHEAGHLAPNVILLQGQVQQTHQTTVTHLQDGVNTEISGPEFIFDYFQFLYCLILFSCKAGQLL